MIPNLSTFFIMSWVCQLSIIIASYATPVTSINDYYYVYTPFTQAKYYIKQKADVIYDKSVK